MVVRTIGHSTRSFEELARVLKAHGVRQLVDVRTVPRSRRNAQFNKDVLGPRLRSRRINYRHLKALGGLRRRDRTSEANAGWRNASFRGYADYMATPAFEAGLAALLRIARARPTAIMCAEAVPWRCHRSLIGDALVARGVAVLDLFDAGHARPHRLHRMAKVRRGRVSYPVDVPLRASARSPGRAGGRVRRPGARPSSRTRARSRPRDRGRARR